MDSNAKQEIALRELLNLLDYDYVVYSDSEYFNLSAEKEEELDINYRQISKSGYVLYYRKREKNR